MMTLLWAGMLLPVGCAFRSPEAPQPASLARGLAFVTRSPVVAPSLSDTTWLTTSVVLHKFQDAAFVGLIDPPGHALDVSWNFGDGQTSTESNIRHAYTTGGNYHAVFTIHDSLDRPFADTVSVAVLCYDSVSNLFADVDTSGLSAVVLSWSYDAIDQGRSPTADLYVSDSGDFRAPLQTGISGTQTGFTPTFSGTRAYTWYIVVHDPTGATDTSGLGSFTSRGDISGTPFYTAGIINQDTTIAAGDSVTFRVWVTSHNCTLTQIRWDYNGDGTTDLSGTSISIAAGCRYGSHGVYRAAMTATSSCGQTSRDTITVTVQ
jgi:hypothetical protein